MTDRRQKMEFHLIFEFIVQIAQHLEIDVRPEMAHGSI